MKWYKVSLTNEQIKRGVHTAIQDDFTSLWMEVNAPEDAAMFDSIKTAGKGITLYLSPGSVKFMIDIINQYLGEETERPKINEVGLLVGNNKAWEMLK